MNTILQLSTPFTNPIHSNSYTSWTADVGAIWRIHQNKLWTSEPPKFPRLEYSHRQCFARLFHRTACDRLFICLLLNLPGNFPWRSVDVLSSQQGRRPRVKRNDPWRNPSLHSISCCCQSAFETIQTWTVDHLLIKRILSVNDSFCKRVGLLPKFLSYCWTVLRT